ncbi:MAG: zinc metallopeptidase [Clostridia bacterium]|nr:zinc metallopeptidase [Clostridia bacterium]
MFYYFDWTLLLVLPAMLFAFWAQIKVQSTFSKYSTVIGRGGYTGATAARRLLDANGLYHVAVMQSNGGKLSDHYDPRNKTLYLSHEVYGSSSAAAVGVACHEAGHALQHAREYAPLKLRMQIIPICSVGSNLAMPIFLVGLILSGAAQAGGEIGYWLMMLGIACFSLATFFQLVTLPVEFNASKRAVEGMRDCGILTSDEIPAAKKVLSAAAMTYVAALAASLLSLLRLLVIANNRRR